jgi:histidinol dehydrogenase
VRAYHERQLLQSWSYTEADGTLLGQKVTPLDRAGLYVPGGKAAYPSSVLMNAIPARVAGVREIIMVVPTPGGQRNELVLAAAAICGVDRVFTIGGAQAVAALAYGTETVPQVDKIVGRATPMSPQPSGVFGTVVSTWWPALRILVIWARADDPEWIAMDLFSQAEHDEMAQSILLSPDGAYLDAVAAAVERLLPTMPRQEVIRASLQDRGALIRVRDLDDAAQIANHIAPEHLENRVERSRKSWPKRYNTSVTFCHDLRGSRDYCVGPNHVLHLANGAFFLAAGRTISSAPASSGSASIRLALRIGGYPAPARAAGAPARRRCAPGAGFLDEPGQSARPDPSGNPACPPTRWPTPGMVVRRDGESLRCPRPCRPNQRHIGGG